MIDMKKKNKMNKVFLFCKIVFMLYSIFNIIAMFFYTGGTAVEPESKGYRFFSNFFSFFIQINISPMPISIIVL